MVAVIVFTWYGLREQLILTPSFSCVPKHLHTSSTKQWKNIVCVFHLHLIQIFLSWFLPPSAELRVIGSEGFYWWHSVHCLCESVLWCLSLHFLHSVSLQNWNGCYYASYCLFRATYILSGQPDTISSFMLMLRWSEKMGKINIFPYNYYYYNNQGLLIYISLTGRQIFSEIVTLLLLSSRPWHQTFLFLLDILQRFYLVDYLLKKDCLREYLVSLQTWRLPLSCTYYIWNVVMKPFLSFPALPTLISYILLIPLGPAAVKHRMWISLCSQVATR